MTDTGHRGSTVAVLMSWQRKCPDPTNNHTLVIWTVISHFTDRATLVKF